MRLSAAGTIASVLGVVALLAACSPAPSPTAADQATPPVSVGPGAAAVDGPTLAAIRARGRVTCGVVEDMPGFATRDILGQWRGFDIDFCRAVAAAVFGDARQVRIVPLDSRTRYRFTALQAGQIDVIPRGSWTFTRDAGQGLDFVAVSYYDNLGFLAPVALKDIALANMGRRSICVEAGTATAQSLADHLANVAENRRPQVLPFDFAQEALAAYRDGSCQLLSGDISLLSAERTTLRNPETNVILTETIAKEPQGPVVRQDDPQWADIVRWTLNSMILGEEMGLTQDTVISERNEPTSAEIANLLSGDGYGQMLSLRDDWAFQVLRQVGGYGEVFDRNVGLQTPLALERAQNALWDAETPGLLFSPPMR